MNALLSHFTLYKSIFVIYNMICNKHHNSSKKSQKTCLVEDMKTCKIQSLEMPKNNVMKKMLNTFFSQIYKVLINGTKKNYKMFYVCWKVWAFFSNTHNWWKFTMLEQIVDIEKFIKCIHVSLDYNDCLVKCAMLFHTRVKKCMQQFLLTSHHSFNNIKLYVKIMKFTNVIHFTHIIIWVAQNDVEIITNDIVTFIHATFNKETKEFIQSIYEMENTFHTIMIRN